MREKAKQKKLTPKQERFCREYVVDLNGNQCNLGLYSDEAEAARAYNRKAIEIFGEFALLNEI